QGARGRLASLVEPDAGQYGAEIGSPNTGGWTVLCRQSHDAARRAGDKCQMPVNGVDIGGECTQDAQGTRVGIDQPCADPTGCRQSQLRGGPIGQWTKIGTDWAG